MKKSEKKLEENKQKKKKLENKPNKKVMDLYDVIVKSTCEDLKNKKDIDCKVLLLSKNNKIIVAQLKDCNDFKERTGMLSLLAKKLIHEKISIDATISISEALMTAIDKDKKEDKKEVLLFTALDKQGNKIQTIYKIIRDKDDIDLENIMNDGQLTMQNNLLGSFWAAYK